MPSRLLPFVTAASLLAGVIAIAHPWSREARAAAGSASSIYVPAEGLVFRTFDGKPIARLSRDARGGVLEVFDEHLGKFAPLPRGDGADRAPADTVRLPYSVDDRDPWLATPEETRVGF